jgi:hypothetical protein
VPPPPPPLIQVPAHLAGVPLHLQR